MPNIITKEINVFTVQKMVLFEKKKILSSHCLKNKQ